MTNTRRFWTAATYFPDLRVRMAQHGITAYALAIQLGHSSGAQMSRWLSGRDGARAETLERIETAFGQLTGEGGPE